MDCVFRRICNTGWKPAGRKGRIHFVLLEFIVRLDAGCLLNWSKTNRALSFCMEFEWSVAERNPPTS